MSTETSSSRAKAALIICLFVSNVAFLQIGMIFGHTPCEDPPETILEDSPETQLENSTTMRDLPRFLVSSILFNDNFTLYNDTWNNWPTNVTPVDSDDTFVCGIGIFFEWDGNRIRLNTTYHAGTFPWYTFNLTLDRVVIYGSIDEVSSIDEYGNARTYRQSVFVDSLQNETTSLQTDRNVQVIFWGRGSIDSIWLAFGFAFMIEIDGAKVPLSLEVEE